MFEGIKHKVGNYYLKKRMQENPRMVTTCNFDTAKRVGFLFEANSREQFEKIKAYLGTQVDKGLEIFAIGYVDADQIDDYFLLRKNINFFCKKDINWYYKPTPPFIDQFIDVDFDLLIDLSMRSIFPLEYISKASRAKFKVGRQIVFPHLDLMITIDENATLNFFLEQLEYYLTILKPVHKTKINQ